MSLLRLHWRLAIALVCWSSVARAECVTLWHSYRGDEQVALQQVVDAFQHSRGSCVESLPVPYDVFASKLTNALGQGQGPDVFIFAHERLGGWVQAGMVKPLTDLVPSDSLSAFNAVAREAVVVGGVPYALPLSQKSVALFMRTDLVQEAPATTDALIALGAPLKARGKLLLAAQTQDFYFHAPWLFGYGGKLLDAQGRIDFLQPAFAHSLDFIVELQRAGLTPEEPTNALVGALFRDGKAAFALSGPWFLGELPADVPFRVVPLPVVSATGLPAKPFVTVECAMLGNNEGRARERTEQAAALMQALAGKESAQVRTDVGHQIVPRGDVVSTDPVLQAFAQQAAHGVLLDARPEMRDVWEPGSLALKAALRGGVSSADAARAADRRYRATTRPQPPPSDARPFVIVVGGALLVLLGVFARKTAAAVRKEGVVRTARAWAWVAPAMVSTGVLVIVPFTVALSMSLFSHKAGAWTFVGFANFVDILLARSFAVLEPLSFYYSLLITIAWTAINLFIHVTVGLALALLLSPKARALKGIYRVLLIVPWAVPNYITALLWKGLFHRQFGAINAIVEFFGGERISWFSSFPTAFFANVCTNAWLGFPFMMVVCLGALQSIPEDMYEAASLEGASSWQQLWHITLPLLRPALLPAIVLGTVWTFNQFNVVYLVSGGEPDGATDILISEAWRWGFSRNEQYGVAAAYGVLIFALLLLWSRFSQRLLTQAEAQR